jgi:hypothetical protein
MHQSSVFQRHTRSPKCWCLVNIYYQFMLISNINRNDGNIISLPNIASYHNFCSTDRPRRFWWKTYCLFSVNIIAHCFSVDRNKTTFLCTEWHLQRQFFSLNYYLILCTEWHLQRHNFFIKLLFNTVILAEHFFRVILIFKVDPLSYFKLSVSQ